MLTAPLAALKKAFPNSEIHVAVMSDWAPLIEDHPGISKLWKYKRSSSKWLRLLELAQLGRSFRKENFDCVLNFHASPSSALISFASRAPLRAVHFHGHSDINHFSTLTIPDKGKLKSAIERDMDVLRALQTDFPVGEMPQIFLNINEIKKSTERLQSFKLSSPLLALGPSASRPTKSWPLDRFALLALEWTRQQKGGVLAFFSTSDQKYADEFLKKWDEILTFSISNPMERKQVHSLLKIETGLELRALGTEISQCALYVGNDSGLKHMAVALGRPTITLFGPEHPLEWHPYDKKNHPYFFVENLSCRTSGQPDMPPWCALHTCIEQNHQCMKLIGVQEVFNECQRVMQR